LPLKGDELTERVAKDYPKAEKFLSARGIRLKQAGAPVVYGTLWDLLRAHEGREGAARLLEELNEKLAT